MYKKKTKVKATKGLITWSISARAEISLRPPGWNIVAITCSISARAQKRKYPWESLLRCENTIDTHARAPFSARAEKNDSDYMDFSARLAGLKILARFENTGLGFSARAESLSM